MKQNLMTKLFALLFILAAMSACQNEELVSPSKINLNIAPRLVCGQVDYTAPTTVNVGEEFTIAANIECGRIALEQGFIEVNGENVYVDLTCATEDLDWEAIVNFECYTDDLSVNLTLNTPGTYVFRTKHQGNDGNCDNFDNIPGSGDPGDCNFNGTQECCFVIEVISCVIDTGDYWTYSHGFFSNNNGEAFLEAHPELGPVQVGCGANIYSYTLDSIANMSPNGNEAPGILVKQIITMTLNVNASSFLASGEDLGCLVVVADEDPLTTLDDLFEGMTVDEVIAAANDFVGGCDTTTFTAGELTGILGAMVDNFHLGETNEGLLTCCEEE